VKRFIAAVLAIFALFGGWPVHAEASNAVVDATAIRGKVLCGYQGWFRCPGDSAHEGWIHWSRDSRKITPQTLTFQLWPDMSEYSAAERFPAPGFTNGDGSQAYLYSAAEPATVRRHFEWMRQYGIDGVWLQHFLVDLPGGPIEARYASRCAVLNNVRAAAHDTGRAWAIAFDIAGMPTDKIVEVLTREWKKLVSQGITADDRYIHEGGLPVVEVWGFYYGDPHNAMTAKVGNALIDFFKTPGSPCRAFVVGGGDWNWRHNSNSDWQVCLRRLDAYSPWNVGNFYVDKDWAFHAATRYWAEDKRECEQRGILWLPVVYPGFCWDNLKQLPRGASRIPREDGKFLWEQFQTLSQLGADSVDVAMFDEVDEGTAIYKVTDQPPVQGHFVTYGKMPSNWYLRLVGDATARLHEHHPIPATIPIQP
jgi:hypothetical protein